jgi:predicted amidohydrolase
MPKQELLLTVHQTAPLLGEIDENRVDLLRRVEGSNNRDLLLFPELSLTGYNLRGRVQRAAVPLAGESPVTLPRGSPPVAMGFPERGEDELVYNSAILVHEGKVLAKHRKVYLPTYGLFDEKRYFAPGKAAPPVVTLEGGWKVGLLVCEDFWHPGLMYLLAIQGAELVVVMAAAPGRGRPDSGTDSDEPTPYGFPSDGPPSQERPGQHHFLFSSTDTWTLLARTAALQYGFFLAIANRAGVEEGVTFAGESTVVGPNGDVLARAPQGEVAILDHTLRREELRIARNPYAHLRDEDPEYLRRALNSLLESP